ncbi:MAG: RagB/SusD family nutrient uptake outer membrane protein [Niabella sp.]
MKDFQYKIYFMIGLLVAISLASCSKFLEHDDPTNVTDANWWKTEANATSALDAVYDGVPDGIYGKQFMFLSALSDELVSRQSARGDYLSYVKGIQGAAWGVGQDLWNADFQYIRRANRFLENVDRCFFADTTLKVRYKYEDRALRAYLHMELLMLFGGIPIETNSVTPASSYLPRDSADQVYDFVINELTDCANYLPASYTTSDMKRITSGACWAMITRLALYYKKYEVAINAARKIIDTGTYSLYTDYSTLFLYAGELNTERIFYKVITSNGYSWNTIAPQGAGGKVVLSPTANIVDAFETLQGKTMAALGSDSAAIYRQNPVYKNNRDPRLTASVLLPGQTFGGLTLNPFNTATSNLDAIGAQYSTATGYWVNKYLDPKDRSASTANRTLDYMIIRLAEIYLSYAEALIESGDWQNTDVLKYINLVRQRAKMPAASSADYNTQEQLRDLVRRERNVELCFEGIRYFDIRRWGLLGTLMNGTVYGATNPATGGSPVTVEERSCNPARDYLWPIPQSEMLANSSMKQNPNY